MSATTEHSASASRAETRPPATSGFGISDDPDLAGNPVARAHARAAREAPTSATAGAHPLRSVLLFTVVIPSIFFLVSNPVGWLVLFLLCLGFAYLIGMGGIL